MSKTAKFSHYLNLGALGEDFSCTIEFEWYKARVQTEDDYDDLEITAVWIALEGRRINVVSSLSRDTIADLVVECWENIE